MRSVAIHIGFHKAASTYLQQHVFPHLQANYLFLDDYKRQTLNMVQSATQFDQKALHDWINQEIDRRYGEAPHELTILSHEELSGHPHGYKTIEPRVVASNLKQAFPSAKIIIIIRDQFSYLLSLFTFRTAIKGMETRSMERFLNEEGSRGLLEKLEYDRIVEHYLSLFGQQSVLVLPMELLKVSPRAFNDAITEFLDLPPTSPAGTEPVNKSTTLLAVLHFWRPLNFAMRSFINILRFLRIEPEEEYPYKWLRYKYYDFKRWVTPRLNKICGFTRKIDITRYHGYSGLFERYSASNERLQKMLKVNLREYGYPVKGITNLEETMVAKRTDPFES